MVAKAIVPFTNGKRGMLLVADDVGNAVWRVSPSQRAAKNRYWLID